MNKYQVTVWNGEGHFTGWEVIDIDGVFFNMVSEDGELWLYKNDGTVIATFARDMWRDAILIESEKGCCCE